MKYSKQAFFRVLPKIILGLVAFMTVALLIGIFAFLFSEGIGALKTIGLKDFFLGSEWKPVAYGTPSWGTFSLFLGTVFVSLVAMVLVIPVGLSTALYLSEIVSVRAREILKPVVEMIASIPSVVLGLLGLLFLAPFIAKMFGLSNGLNALTAAILVGIAALPTVASICEDALSSVPQRYRDSSLALGATKWATIKKVVIPAASPGIIAALMLGLGRVIGETMIVLMVAGNSRGLPNSVLDPVRPMTANIAIEIKEVVVNSLHWESLFAIGLALFVLTFLINFLADILIHRKS